MKTKTLVLAAFAGAFIWTLLIVACYHIFNPDTPPLPAGPIPATQTSLRV